MNGHLCQFCPAFSFALTTEGDFETSFVYSIAGCPGDEREGAFIWGAGVIYKKRTL